MLLKITTRRQITLPTQALDTMGVGSEDWLELMECLGGYLLRPRGIYDSRLGTLREMTADTHPLFDIRGFRYKPYVPALRD